MDFVNGLHIRPITPTEAGAVARLLRGAYPSDAPDPLEQTVEAIRKHLAEMPDIEWAGAFDGDTLVGTLRIHAFEMSCFGAMVPCGGLGGVAVALAHKKRGVARDMVEWFIDHCSARGDVVLALYPFRQDFYRSMGWGHGTPLQRYRIEPRYFPATPEDRVRRLCEEDGPAIEAFLDRHVRSTHGMFRASPRRVEAMATADTKSDGYHSFGFFEGDRLTGAVTATFKSTAPDNSYKHDLVVEHWCHETPRALRALLGFFRSQSDQVGRIDVASFDPWFHHHVANSESDTLHSFRGHVEVARRGLGIMWRLVGVRRFLEALAEHRWGPGKLVLGVTLPPTLGQPGGEREVISFAGGRATTSTATPDVELELSTGDFASLALGVVPLSRLVEGGHARVVPPERAGELGRIFRADAPPICDTSF